jgi:hypothetical protein
MANKCYKFRYLLGCILLVLGVAFNLNFSSIGSFQSVFNDYGSNEKPTQLLKERSIRSDEWLVQTPYNLSQSMNGLKTHSEQLNQNGIVFYNAPVKDLTIIGKPFNWGYLFLPKDRAFSFYWMLKLISLLLVSFEFSMIILKRKKVYACISALLITFSPGVQWWFAQHLGDLIFFTLAIMTMLYHFIAYNHKWWKNVLLACGLTISVIGFILVIYPAFQIPLAYLICFWTIGIFLIERPKTINWSKIALTIGSVFVIAIVMWHFYQISKNDLHALLNTIYPGSRRFTGHQFTMLDLAEIAINPLIVFHSATGFSNNCEVAGFYHLMPFVPLLLIHKKAYDKIDRLLFVFYAWLIAMVTFLSIGLPTILAKVALASFMTDGRLMTIIHFVSMLATIMLLNSLKDLAAFDKKHKLIISGLIALYWSILITGSGIAQYFTTFGRLEHFITPFIAIVLAIFVYALLSLNGQSKLAQIIVGAVLGVCVLSGMLVNPIVVGTKHIDNLKISQSIQSLRESNPQAIWASDVPLGYGLLTANGVKTFSQVRFYPDIPRLKLISDDEKNDELIYNRYHHRNLNFTNQPKTSFSLLGADNILINVNKQDLHQLSITYLVSKKDLSKLYHAKKVYGPDKNGNFIYELP